MLFSLDSELYAFLPLIDTSSRLEDVEPRTDRASFPHRIESTKVCVGVAMGC